MPRTDMMERHGQLCKQIEDAIVQNGKEFDGKLWAVGLQQAWADKLGVSSKSISRLIRIPPIHRDCRMIDGSRKLLLRVGPPEKPTPRQIAQAMYKAFKAQTGKQIGARAFGCLVGLAEVLPDGHELEIFRETIEPHNWAVFMLWHKADFVVIDDSTGVPFLKIKPGFKLMFFQYPHIPTLRKFSDHAVELWKERKYEH